jgi:hypothetical protein
MYDFNIPFAHGEMERTLSTPFLSVHVHPALKKKFHRIHLAVPSREV